jgi:hypothetical protein
MYSGSLRRPFLPDESALHHTKEREEYTKQLLGAVLEQKTEPRREKKEEVPQEKSEKGEGEKKEEGGLFSLLNEISPEDSALIALILFLLCDNTDNDVVLLGILLYVLLSK